MKLTKRVLLGMLLSAIVGFTSGIGIKTAYESTIFKPYEWPRGKEPIILNCYGSDFSKLQMVRAIEYWTLRGHHVAFYEHNPDPEVCENDWLEGFIILRKAKVLSPEGTIASTRRFTSGIYMRGAEIRYTPRSFNLDLLNEHELGHALGYGHVEKLGHIMHPHYGKMGRDFSIP
tara:strand:- start:761 stop:1282 length:522 start_codon:yes stop_codon:yes gene_type:complete